MLLLQLTLAKLHCLVFWILLLRLTLLTMPSSLRDYVLRLVWLTVHCTRWRRIWRVERSMSVTVPWWSVNHHTCILRCTQGFGTRTRSLPAICSRCYRAGQRVWPYSSSVCWRPSDSVSADTQELVARMTTCIERVRCWMASNRLRLNPTVEIGTGCSGGNNWCGTSVEFWTNTSGGNF